MGHVCTRACARYVKLPEAWADSAQFRLAHPPPRTAKPRAREPGGYRLSRPLRLKVSRMHMLALSRAISLPLTHPWRSSPLHLTPPCRTRYTLSLLSSSCVRLLSCTRAPSIPLHGKAHAHTMALVDEQHEWGAQKVRQTFLDYFKQNGHTFGMLELFLISCLLFCYHPS